MDHVRQVEGEVTGALAQSAFDGLGCVAQGVVVLRGAQSWGAHENGSIELPTADGPLTVRIGYDERRAPSPVDEAGHERRGLLLSLSDEGDHLACAWAQVPEGSQVVGVGVDLCAREHFRERETPRRRDLSLLLFTEGERELLEGLCPGDPELGKAVLFAAKEAAFKATAAPLRRWYETHDEELSFEVRHFVMEEPGLERGTGRNGAAQAAMDAMGIARIEVRHTEVCDMALVCAVALAH